jgi:hypothetical protein
MLLTIFPYIWEWTAYILYVKFLECLRDFREFYRLGLWFLFKMYNWVILDLDFKLKENYAKFINKIHMINSRWITFIQLDFLE